MNALTVDAALFARGDIIRHPAGSAPGYWAGAPGLFFAARERAWYLTYRIRRPRGVAPDRGGEARLARSTDLKNWEDIWCVTKDKFGTASIERCCLYCGEDGVWRNFVSYVDPGDGRWCVSVLKARELSRLSPANPEPLFRAQPLGLEGVKDPWLIEQGGIFYMFLSIALPTAQTSGQSHSTLDIFNTGDCVSATGLASSRDLENWEWLGVAFRPSAGGWDRYCRRINSVLPVEGRFLAFYDGSASHAENYEEKTGLAISFDLRQWQTLTPHAPLWTSPHGSGSLRYMNVLPAEKAVHIFYEFARPDAAHDLRRVTVDGSFGSKLMREAASSGAPLGAPGA